MIYILYVVLSSLLFAARPNYRPYEVILPAVIILAFGAWVSRQVDDWSWFARSGSLLVIIAASMHLWNIKEKIENAKNSIINSLDQGIDQLSQLIDEYEVSDGIFTSLCNQLSTCRARFEGFDIAAVENTYKRYEIVAAIIGTLVWGFGDLIGRFV